MNWQQQEKRSQLTIEIHLKTILLYSPSIARQNLNLDQNTKQAIINLQILFNMIQQGKDTNSYKIRVYLTTFFTVLTFNAMLAAFPMIKDKLNKQLQLQQDFLSFLDNLYYIGKILGSLIILTYPSKKPKLAFFLISIFNLVCQLLLTVSVFFGQYGRYIMLIGTLGNGVSKIYIAFPYFLISQHFDKENDKFQLAVWNSFRNTGDLIGIFLTYIMIYDFNLRWELPYNLCVLFYFLSVLIFYLSVQQFSPNQNAQQEQDMTIKQKIIKCSVIVKESFSKLEQFLRCMDFCLQTVYIAIVLSWFPFYFVQNGYGLTQTFIAAALFASRVIGTFIFNYFLQKIDTKWADLVTAGLIFEELVLMIVGTLFLMYGVMHSMYFVIIIIIIGFLDGGVYNEITTSDFLIQGGETKQVRYYSVFFTRFIQSILAILFSTLTGQLMKRNQIYLFYVLIGILFLSFTVFSTRKFFIKHLDEYFQLNELEYTEVQNKLNALE